MTYHFAGVIAPGGDAAIARALSSNFGGVWRELEDERGGFVLALAADQDRLEVAAAFDDALVAWSRSFPEQPFVWLRVECFGGVCDQWGFAFANGKVIARDEDEGARAGPTPLENLMAACGSPLPTGSFAPFERNWFSQIEGKMPGRDRTMMRAALILAQSGAGFTGDNPVVGCLIDGVRDGIFGEARTANGGRPHAEEQALAQAGADARGATVYVTLEPCAKRSSGAPSCADLLIQAGVARVVIAASDPHSFAAGAGVERLRAAGIQVETGLFADEARALNPAFHAKWG